MTPDLQSEVSAALHNVRVVGRTNGRHAHLIGMAGSGMRALADVLAGQGWTISGSDLAPANDQPTVCVGHAPQHVPASANLVVYSDAIGQDNCELRRAGEQGAAVLSYPQMLGRLMRGRRGLAVAGTHGKSTTAGMAAEILRAAGLEPTALFGATPLGRTSGGMAGRGDLMLAEACEYRANFCHLRAEISLILAIEEDHFDCFASRDELETAFARFAQQTKPDGLMLACADCPASLRAARHARCRRETFGLGPAADWRAVDIESQNGVYRFRLSHRDREMCNIRLRVPGRHNVLNALAAAALATAAGAPAEAIARGLNRFRGLRRRIEQAGRIGGVPWIDDYAHHPTEVRATLATVRAMYPARRLWCVFQPHQISRTVRLLEGFASSLQAADRILIADVFRARESADEPGDVAARALVAQTRRLGGAATGPGSLEQIEEVLASAIGQGELTPGDIMVTMGAGNIEEVGKRLGRRFCGELCPD